jgi:hypothetical protein
MPKHPACLRRGSRRQNGPCPIRTNLDAKLGQRRQLLRPGRRRAHQDAPARFRRGGQCLRDLCRCFGPRPSRRRGDPLLRGQQNLFASLSHVQRRQTSGFRQDARCRACHGRSAGRRRPERSAVRDLCGRGGTAGQSGCGSDPSSGSTCSNCWPRPFVTAWVAATGRSWLAAMGSRLTA